MLRPSLMAFAVAMLCCTSSMAQQGENRAMNGKVELAYWSHGPDNGTSLIVINGQGAATRPLGDGLTTSLTDRGFRVILFDNRDSGRSTVLSAAGAPPSLDDIMQDLAKGKAPAVAYGLSEMADDAIAVLDAAGIERAHILGHSLGGMIAQVLAAEHPDRALSLISVSSTSGEPGLPFGPAMNALNEMSTEATETPAAQQARIYRIFEGDARLRITDDEIAARVAADQLVADPNAAARQLAAASSTGDRTGLLRTVSVPTLVLHGDVDPWFPIAHAESTAAALAAPVVRVEGMGHIISDAAAADVAAHVSDFVRKLTAP